MVTKVLTVLALFLGLPAFAQSVALSWTSNGNPGIANCSSTVTTTCISGYTAEITSVAGVTLATPQVLSASISPTALSYTYALPTFTLAGADVFAVLVNGVNAAGSTISSPPATVSVTVPAIPPAAPAGLSATVSQ